MTFNPGDEVEVELGTGWQRAALIENYAGGLCHLNVECQGSRFLYCPGGHRLRPYTPPPQPIIIGVSGTKDGLDEAIDANPLDWAWRSVYADWLEESGCTWLMDGQRYQIENKKTPGPACVMEAAWHEATWFLETLVNTRWLMQWNKSVIIKPEWCISINLFQKLRGYILYRRDGGHHNQYAKSWNSRREAEIALAMALS